METKKIEAAKSKSSTGERRHGPGEGQRYLTDLIRIEDTAAPAWLRELDEAIARYVGSVFARETHKIAEKIKPLQKELSLQRMPADGRIVNWAVLGQLRRDIKNLRHSVRDLYEKTYQATWESMLTQNGTRLMVDVVRLPNAAQIFPTEGKTKLLKIAFSEEDPAQAQHAFETTLDRLWPGPKAQVVPVVPVRREASVSADAPAPRDVPEAELDRLASPSKPDELPIEVVVIDVPDHKVTRVPIREADPVPSESRELETRGVPVERALIPVSEPVAPRAEGRGWGHRILGTLFNAAAGAGAGMAVRAGVLSLTGGSVVAALGAGAAFSGLVSVGRQHAENVRARRLEDPQAQGWALHREVFAQNRKSYLNRFLTSCAVFAGAGAVGYAYGDQIAAWVSDKIDSVAGLFHSAAGDAAPSAVPSVAPQTAVPAPAPVEAVVSPAPVEVPSPVETPPVVSQPPVTAVDVPATPAPVSTPVVETPAPIMESPAAPVDSRTLALENARTLLQGEKLSSEVQDALRRAASENPRLGAQGLKDLADHFSGTNSAFAYKLAEEALKVNPDNAQAALFVAHYQTHGLGGASSDLSGAYEKAAQVQGSPHAGAAQRHEARDLLRYLTRTLGFRPA